MKVKLKYKIIQLVEIILLIYFHNILKVIIFLVQKVGHHSNV